MNRDRGPSGRGLIHGHSPSPLDWAEESPPVGPEASAHAGRWLTR